MSSEFCTEQFSGSRNTFFFFGRVLVFDSDGTCFCLTAIIRVFMWTEQLNGVTIAEAECEVGNLQTSLKGTATLTISMFDQKELYKP